MLLFVCVGMPIAQAKTSTRACLHLSFTRKGSKKRDVGEEERQQSTASEFLYHCCLAASTLQPDSCSGRALVAVWYICAYRCIIYAFLVELSGFIFFLFSPFFSSLLFSSLFFSFSFLLAFGCGLRHLITDLFSV